MHFTAEHLRELRWAAEQCGIVSFGPDDEFSFSEYPTRQSLIAADDAGISFQEPKPPDGFPKWWFTATSKAEYLRGVEKLVQQSIELDELLSSVNASHQQCYVREVRNVAARYCDSVEDHLSRTSGWRKTKVFKDHRAHLRRVVWTVMFQVEGKCYSEIAAAMETELGKKPAVSTVQRGICEVLDTLGFDVDKRRGLKRGPKLGSSHSEETKARREILKSLAH